jgi:hypothetical protein
MKTNYFFRFTFLVLIASYASCLGQGTPFNCDYNAYLFQNNDVFALDLASGNSYEVATDIVPGKINATGYNPTDGYIWGSLNTPLQTLVRIGKNFEITEYVIPELPISNRYVGDVSDDGIYFLKQGGDGVHKVDINPDSPNYGQYIEYITISQSLNIHDWAFNAVDGNLYAVEKASNHLYRIEPSNGQVIDLGEVPILQGYTYTYGAVYFDDTGRFYISANQTGTVFVVQDVQNLSPNDPIASNLFAYGPSSSSNDGARCPTAPVLQEICGNGIDDDGDGLIDCDDPSCSGVGDCPTQNASGGNEGGLESNGRLSKKINARNFGRLKSNYTFDKSQARNFKKTDRYATQQRGNNFDLVNFVPMDIINEDSVIESTPTDLISITNASDILSIDYEKDNNRIAAIMILKTENAVYEHTKYICDRLLGAELLSVSTVELRGENFIKSIIKNPDGGIEFVLSFSSKTVDQDSNFSIESHWNLDSYTSNTGFINFQIWSNSLEDLMKLGEETLRLLEVQLPISEYATTSPPTVFVKSGSYGGGKLHLEIVNTNASQGVTLEGGISRTETSAIETVTQEIELGASYISTEEVDLGAFYDIGFRISNENGDTPDDLFLSDGPWGVDSFASSTNVNSFEVTENQSPLTIEGFPLERAIKLNASTQEYVSVYRAFNPKFRPVNLESFNQVAFDAFGTGRMEVTLVKESISEWENQFRTHIELSETDSHYVLPYSQFKNTTGSTMNLEDVTTILFTMVSDHQERVVKQLSLSNLRFGLNESQEVLEDTSDKILLFPNPVNSQSSISFYADNQSILLFSVYSLTGQLMMQQKVDARSGTNTIPILVNGLNDGMYLYEITGSKTKYQPGKLIVSK